MKFVHREIDRIFAWDKPLIQTLVVENQSFFRKVLKDVFMSFDGYTTPAVLSVNNKPVQITKHAEVITDFINFTLNQKTLINRICSALEQTAISPENYLETQKLLSHIENKVNKWAFEFPCDIIASRISTSNLLKAIGIEINEDYHGESGDAEKLIDYMELVREFDRDKLFITVNMRNYFSDPVICKFMKTVLSHEYKILMIEANSYPILDFESRTTIDYDLCEF